jgi:hypothetical protein
MTLYEIVKRLVGNIEPYGDSCIDETRHNNLRDHSALTYNLVEDLIKTAGFKDRHENSIKVIGTEAYKELLELKEVIDYAIKQGD